MNPTFGDKVEGAHYQTRYGVYAVIPNQEKTKIILVQAPNGAWFLPGGEIEAGEDHYSALERELIEELGFTATLGQYYGQADEYFYSSHRDTYYYNPAYIYEVVDFSKIGMNRTTGVYVKIKLIKRLCSFPCLFPYLPKLLLDMIRN